MRQLCFPLYSWKVQSPGRSGHSQASINAWLVDFTPNIPCLERVLNISLDHLVSLVDFLVMSMQR